MEEPRRIPSWLWLNVVSLDAPIVALVWQDFLHRCYPSTLRPAARLVLGLTVWAIYLADRLLDVRHPATQRESARHAFYRRNSRLAITLLAIVLGANFFVAVAWLRPAVLSSGLLPAAAVIVYLAIFARWRIGAPYHKQLCAAVLFATGVFLVAWPQVPNPWRTFGWPAAAFCALCFGNLILIESSEHGVRNSRGWMYPLLLALFSAGLGRSLWYTGVAIAAAGLTVLDLFNSKLQDEPRRVLADAVLLAPLLLR
jgi:hypothetical protein